MKRRGVRAGLVLLFLVIAVGAAYEVVRVEQQVGRSQSAVREFDEQADAIARAVLELRAAQQAYVAAGQERDYWMSKVSTQLASVGEEASALSERATTADGRAALDSTIDGIGHFAEMDGRARDYVVDGQPQTASDLIFTDGLELTNGAIDTVGVARAAEWNATAGTTQGHRMRQAAVLAIAGAAGLLFLLLLAPRPQEGQKALINELDTPSSAAAVDDVTDDHEAEGSAAAVDEPDVAGETLIEETGGSQPAPSDPSGAPDGPNLQAAAVLCTDLGRVAVTEELPSLLKRAAELIDASGIIIWLSDQDGSSLRPVLAHGYSPHALARMGDIPCDSDNATAAAFRTAKIQVVSDQPGDKGAIAAPLLAATGCVGVMAAEVRNDGESHEPTRAVASIIAAQLTTLVGGSPPAAAEARSESA